MSFCEYLHDLKTHWTVRKGNVQVPEQLHEGARRHHPAAAAERSQQRDKDEVLPGKETV